MEVAAYILSQSVKAMKRGYLSFTSHRALVLLQAAVVLQCPARSNKEKPVRKSHNRLFSFSVCILLNRTYTPCIITAHKRHTAAKIEKTTNDIKREKILIPILSPIQMRQWEEAAGLKNEHYVIQYGWSSRALKEDNGGPIVWMKVKTS